MGPLPVAVGDDRSDHRSTAMTTLLLAEHDNKTLKDATQKALTAAKALGQDVHVLAKTVARLPKPPPSLTA